MFFGWSHPAFAGSTLGVLPLGSNTFYKPDRYRGYIPQVSFGVQPAKGQWQKSTRTMRIAGYRVSDYCLPLSHPWPLPGGLKKPQAGAIQSHAGDAISRGNYRTFPNQVNTLPWGILSHDSGDPRGPGAAGAAAPTGNGNLCGLMLARPSSPWRRSPLVFTDSFLKAGQPPKGRSIIQDPEFMVAPGLQYQITYSEVVAGSQGNGK